MNASSDFLSPDTGKSLYILSRDLRSTTNTNLRIKVITLDGSLPGLSMDEILSDPLRRFAEPTANTLPDIFLSFLVYSGGKPISLEARTCFKAFYQRFTWNEWITLPIQIADIPRDALLVATLYEMNGPYQLLPIGGTSIPIFGKHGKLRCGTHDLLVWPKVAGDGSIATSTPGKLKNPSLQMGRLAKLVKRHRSGRLQSVDWLDRLTFREVELINEREKREMNAMFLMIEFPPITLEDKAVNVIYYEEGADYRVECIVSPSVVKVVDEELDEVNLTEDKHIKLTRQFRATVSDRELKPDWKQRDELNAILAYPPDQKLTKEDPDLVWGFRFYLSSNKKALARVLAAVQWGGPMEEHVEKLLRQWQPLDPEDTLELLTSKFTQPLVRQYAVERLSSATDENLLLYLLQLVQALRYEDLGQEAMTPTSPSGRKPSVLRISPEQEKTENPFLPKKRDLATFLIQCACRNPKLATYFYWYLRVECDKTRQMEVNNPDKTWRNSNPYFIVAKRLSETLQRGDENCRAIWTMLSRQVKFVELLVQIMKKVSGESGNRKKKIEKLQELLRSPDSKLLDCLSIADPLPHPLDPDVKIVGIKSEAALLFKSAQMPARLTFIKEDGSEFVTIFKLGDDLRQDQLVLQIITLMDKLLRQENLDLKLTPYKVIATSIDHGFVQFIDSAPVAEIQANEGTILNFLRKYSPSKTNPNGVSTEAMENYVKSCAGYCVVTYLLGVGDRHLENLLLTKQGQLFHIDFSYILGRDPKPMPPAMKLSTEMVDTMGGTTSEYFTMFCIHCYSAFLNLRRSANLILSLFYLMIDSNIADIALEPDKTVKKVHDKFRLDLNDDEAIHYLQTLIEASVGATFPAMVDTFRKIVQWVRP